MHRLSGVTRHFATNESRFDMVDMDKRATLAMEAENTNDTNAMMANKLAITARLWKATHK